MSKTSKERHKAVLARALTLAVRELVGADELSFKEKYQALLHKALMQLVYREQAFKYLKDTRKISCSRKVKFDTRQDGEQYLSYCQVQGAAPEGAYVYECKFCDGFHLTYARNASPKCRCYVCPVHGKEINPGYGSLHEAVNAQLDRIMQGLGAPADGFIQ